jgi:hypothetical protein
MSCHQTGDVRVLKPGKNYKDFRPGTPLDDTLSILIVPPKREAPPQQDLLEHYYSMTLSKCYRDSGHKLSCISCHDPHAEPTSEEAPAYFRRKCLACHSEQSCRLTVEVRQRQHPADDCAGCHMLKRDVREISHSSITNHAFWRVRMNLSRCRLSADHRLCPTSSIDPAPDRGGTAPARFAGLRELVEKHPEYLARYNTVLTISWSVDPLIVVQGALATRTCTPAKLRIVQHLRRAIHDGAAKTMCTLILKMLWQTAAA